MSSSTSVRTAADRCPGAWRRHEAADGTMARLRPVGGAIAAPELALLARAARSGGAPVEITSRASLQVRGLDASTADTLAEALRSPRPDALLDLDGRELACGLLAPAHTGVLDDAVARVATGLRGRSDLPGRLLVALELDGEPSDRPRADVAVVVGPDGATLWLDGPDGEVDAGLRHDDPAALALAAVEAFAGARGSSWRLREVPDGVDRVAADVRAVIRRPRGSGRTRTPDQRADTGTLAVAPRLGEIGDAAAAALLDEDATLRVTPSRTLVLRDLGGPDDVAAARRRLDGPFEVDPSSPWWGLSACVGAPRCAKALADVRGDLADAVARGEVRGREHWVGCARGCGTPDGAVTLVTATELGETTIAYRREERSGTVIG